MNSQLPPIDSAIRDQLARRSAGRMPEGLLAEVLTAADSAPARRGGDGWPRLIWRVPRLAVAGMGVALVAILAVAIVLPAVRTGPAAPPARYPADRALTTAELAAVMAGPALATNTALVAAVAIDARDDICPMNRYPTVGVVEGMASQVCVMGSNLAAQIQVPKATGTFAFRYLGPGYLGLLGEITPAPSRLPHTVTDEWPLAGKTFLVSGWLGAIGPPIGVAVSCADAATAGDVLDPGGGDCPFTNWLSDDPTAPSIESKVVSGWQSTDDTLVLRGRARYVDAGGARVIDSIDHATPTYGTYVVRSTTEQCPGAAPQDSRGCAAWLVLAKVADLTLPEPSPEAATPSPTTAPPATPVGPPVAPTGLIGPGNRALTADELAALIAADPTHLSDRYVIDRRVTCDGIDCSGVAPSVLADNIQSDGTIGLIGPVNVRPDGGIVWTVPQIVSALPSQPGIYIVDAWIGGAAEDSCDVVGVAAGAAQTRTTSCYEVSWLGATPGGQEVAAQLGAYHQFGAGPVGGGAPIHGLFLFEWVQGGKCGVGFDPGIDTCTPHAGIVARLEPPTP